MTEWYIRVDCETRAGAEDAQRLLTAPPGADPAAGLAASALRVLVSGLGLRPTPRLSGEASREQAAADAAKYGWGVRKWDALGRTHPTLIVVCAGDGWLDLAGRRWMTCEWGSGWGWGWCVGAAAALPCPAPPRPPSRHPSARKRVQHGCPPVFARA